MSVKAILTEQQKSYTKAEEDALLSDYYNKDYIDTYMAPLDTPTFVGQPKAPTAAAGTNTTQIATTAFVEQAKNTRVPVYGMGKSLLDNWYFVKPVNQRGQSTYSSIGYSVDRWKIVNNNTIMTITAQDTRIKASSNGTQAIIDQYVNNPELLLGKTLTVTAWLSTGLETLTFTMPSSYSTGYIATGTRLYVGADSSGHVYVRLVHSNTWDLYVYACKLELGSEQTLCHNEGTDANPVWVLNEVPDYEYELYRCITSTADSSDTYANKTLATGQELAYVENGTTASRVYSVGERFCWGGTLYRAKTAIASGASFTVGTNCEVVSGGGLNSIISDFSPHLLGSKSFTTFDSTNKPIINLSDSIYNYRFISVVFIIANYEHAASTIPVTASFRHTSVRLEESDELYALALVSNLHTTTPVVYNFYASSTGWTSTAEKIVRVYGIGKI